MAALVGYGAIILSFMGGVLWGLEVSQGRSQAAYAVSIVPALVAVAAMLSPATYGILLLLCGFAGLLAYDVKYQPFRGRPKLVSGPAVAADRCRHCPVVDVAAICEAALNSSEGRVSS